MIATGLHRIYNQIQRLCSETHRIQIEKGAPRSKIFKTPPETTVYNVGRGHQFAGWELFDNFLIRKFQNYSDCLIRSVTLFLVPFDFTSKRSEMR